MIRVRPSILVTAVALVGAGLVSIACAERAGGSDGEAGEDALVAPAADSVEAAARRSCTTDGARGLSQQLVDELNCLSPGTLAAIPPNDNVDFQPAVLTYLQPSAAKAFTEAVDAYAAKKPAGSVARLTVSSALRTLPQQYMVSQWARRHICGVPLAAVPGTSKHETGLAIDIENYGTGRAVLTAAHGFTWFGNSDKVHFTYGGADTTDITSLSVQAFQRLWTRNHPDDPLAESGKYDAATEARLKASPIGGFALGASCVTPKTDTRDGASADAIVPVAVDTPAH